MPRTRNLLVGFTFGLVLSSVAALATCNPTEVDLDSTLRLPAASSIGVQELMLSLPAAGMLALDLSAPGSTLARDHLASGSAGCLAGVTIAQTVAVAAGPRSWVLDVRQPGELFFAVEADDPALPLPALKLRTAFTADPATIVELISPLGDVPDQCSTASTSHDNRLSPESDYSVFSQEVDPWECDIVLGKPPRGGVASFQSEDLPLHVTLWSGPDCTASSQTASGALATPAARLAGLLYAGSFQVAIDSWAGSAGPYSLAVRHYDLCSRGEVDDHGDDPLCATPIAFDESLVGKLENGFGDDADLFSFVMAAPATVVLTLDSTASAGLRLLDHQGQPLGTWLHGGGASPLVIHRSLAAGRYFLASEQAAAAEARYQVTVSLATP